MELTKPNIGDEIRIRGCLHQWLACPLCGQGRWVRFEKGIPRSTVCRHCCSTTTRKKMSESRLGYPCSQETRDKISKARMGHIGYMLGKHHTDETKAKLSILKRGSSVSDTTREKIRQSLLGKPGHKVSEETKEKLRLFRLGQRASPETRERLRLSHLGYKPSQSTRELLSQASYKKWEDPNYRERVLASLHSPTVRLKAADGMRGHVVHPGARARISASLMGHSFSDGTLAKMSETQQRLWSRPEYRNRVIKAMRVGLLVTPNKCEQAIQNILDLLYPNEWRFVGDGEFIIAGKNPDFININGKKQIIELFGDYWHRGENPQKRIDLFKQYGYNTLIIWERELKDDADKLFTKIQEFVG